MTDEKTAINAGMAPPIPAAVATQPAVGGTAGNGGAQAAVSAQGCKSGFSDRRAKSFDYAAEATKQLIALATGVIAFTVTFSKDYLASVSKPLKVVAAGSWALYVISACAGLLILYALAGQLDPGGELEDESKWSGARIWAGSVRGLMMVQQVMFALALLVTVAFASLAIFGDRPPTRVQSPDAAAGAVTPTPAAPTQ